MRRNAKIQMGKKAYHKGHAAEQQAADYLHTQGFDILHTRYRNAYGEIDLIARKAGRLHFIEVKARKSLEDGLYALSAKQQQRLMQAAEMFLAEHVIYQQADSQFDLIAIADWQLQHVEHILMAE